MYIETKWPRWRTERMERMQFWSSKVISMANEVFTPSSLKHVIDPMHSAFSHSYTFSFACSFAQLFQVHVFMQHARVTHAVYSFTYSLIYLFIYFSMQFPQINWNEIIISESGASTVLFTDCVYYCEYRKYPHLFILSLGTMMFLMLAALLMVVVVWCFFFVILIGLCVLFNFLLYVLNTRKTGEGKAANESGDNTK